MCTSYQEALAYARGGLRVFPLAPRGKHPLTPHGFKDATTEEGIVGYWWNRWPEANVGVATEGYAVLDLDPRSMEGDGIQAVLDAHNAVLPETVHAFTGGGGDHYWFRGEMPSRKLAPGIEVKGTGGYVVMPPSVHPGGGIYRWEPGHAPGEIESAALPDWLIENGGTGRGRTTTPGEWVRRLRGVPEGERNDTAAQLAGRLIGLGMAPSEALAWLELWDARNQPPLGERELEKVAESIARREARRCNGN